MTVHEVNWKRAGLRIGGAFLSIALLIVFLAAALLIVLRTDAAKDLIAEKLSGSLSSGPDRIVTLEQVEIELPPRVRVKGFTLGDAEGIWLVGKDLALGMSLSDLLGGEFHFVKISASSVVVKRSPKSGEPEEPEKTGPIALPENPPPVTVDRLSVDRLVLEEPVTGDYAVFRLDGNVEDASDGAGSESAGQGPGLRAALHARRIDDAPDTGIHLAASIHGKRGEPSKLGIQAEVREEAGGWIASALDRKDDGPISIELRGDGPLEDWTGSLKGDIRRYGSVNADIRLTVSAHPSAVARGDAAEQEIAVGLKGVAVPSRDIFSPGLTPLLGSESRFELNARYALSSGLVAVENAKIEGAKYSAQVDGRFDPGPETIQSNLNITIGDLKAVEALAGMPLAGALTVTGNVSNTLRAPHGAVALRLNDLKAENLHAADIRADVRLETDEADRNGALNATATLRMDGLKLLTAANGRTAAANGVVEVQLEGNPTDGNATGTIRGRLKGMEGLPPAVASLSGAEIELGANVALRGKTLLDVSRLQVTGSNVRAESTVSVNLAEKTVKGNWRVAIPALDAPARALGKRMAGSIEAEGEVAGPFTSLETTTSIKGNKVRVEGVETRQPAATIHVRGLPRAPQGEVRVGMRQNGQNLSAAADFALEGERLSLPRISLDAPRNRIAGNLDIDLAAKQAEGNLEGKLNDISVLGRFVGERLGGSAAFSIRPFRENGSQHVKLVVDGKGLVTPYAGAAKVSASADVRDIFNKPVGSASIQAADVKGAGADGPALRTLNVKASGDRRGGSSEASAAGRYTEGFDLRTPGGGPRSDRPGDTAQQVRVKSLSGRFGGYALQLSQPAVLATGRDGFSLDGLALGVGGARLQAAGRYSPKSATLDARIDKLPLSMGRLFGVPDVPGILSGRIRMDGPSGQPIVDVEMDVTGLRPPADRMPGAPAMAVSATARIEGGKMNARADIQGPFEGPAHATLTLPVRFAVAPFAFRIPPEGAIQGHVEARGNLATLAAMVPQEEHGVTGQIKVLFDIGGTLANPETNGSAEILNGTYTNFSYGATLRNIHVELAARGRRLEIRRAESSDGGSGTISARGWMEVAPEKNFPLEADVSVVNATLVRREEVTGSVGGALKVTGNIVDMTMTGKLDIIGAEASIPRQFSTHIAKLDVIELNGPVSSDSGRAGTAEKAEARRGDERRVQVGRSRTRADRGERDHMQPARAAPGPTQTSRTQTARNIQVRAVQPQTAQAEPLHQAGDDRAPSAASSATPTNVRLNITVYSQGRVFIRGRGLNSEWKGDLQVAGAAGEPSITGNLSVVRGYLDILDKRFNLSRGIIQFHGGSPPTPWLDVVAEARAQDVTARVSLTGNATSPKIEFQSDPPLPQDEVLARVLFGRELGKITPVQALKLANALRVVSGGGDALGFLTDTRKFLGLDQLDIRTPTGNGGGPSGSASSLDGKSNHGGGGTNDVALGIGKYLTEDIYVDVEKGVGNKTGKVTVQVEITPNLSLETQTGLEGNSGIGLNWKYDY